jgi:hypothetical protein
LTPDPVLARAELQESTMEKKKRDFAGDCGDVAIRSRVQIPPFSAKLGQDYRRNQLLGKEGKKRGFAGDISKITDSNRAILPELCRPEASS